MIRSRGLIVDVESLRGESIAAFNRGPSPHLSRHTDRLIPDISTRGRRGSAVPGGSAAAGGPPVPGPPGFLYAPSGGSAGPPGNPPHARANMDPSWRVGWGCRDSRPTRWRDPCRVGVPTRGLPPNPPGESATQPPWYQNMMIQKTDPSSVIKAKGSITMRRYIPNVGNNCCN